MRCQVGSRRSGFLDSVRPILKSRELVYDAPSLEQTRQRCRNDLAKLYTGVKRFLNPHERTTAARAQDRAHAHGAGTHRRASEGTLRSSRAAADSASAVPFAPRDATIVNNALYISGGGVAYRHIHIPWGDLDATRTHLFLGQ